jgi:hypothetical protein
MSVTHTVRQGENLSSIARRYKIANWKDIYDDPANEHFRSLRPNPNLIYPGDSVVIPDIKPQATTLSTGQEHRIVVRRYSQVLKIRLLNAKREPVENARVTVDLPGGIRTLQSNSQGIVEIGIQSSDPSSFVISVHETPNAETAQEYMVQTNHLDPLDTISGIQARLNALGFAAGPIDGAMGKKTRAGIEAFQRSNPHLTVDGVAGPDTRAALEEAYGC